MLLSGIVLFGLQYHTIKDSIRHMNAHQQGGSKCKLSSGNIKREFIPSTHVVAKGFTQS